MSAPSSVLEYSGGFRRLFLGSFLAVTGLLSLAERSSATDWRDETTYKVTITVYLDIPKSEKVDRVRVIHALPLQAKWAKGDRKSGARNISSSPSGGRTKVDPRTGGAYVEWERRVPSSGGQFEFTTTYEITSATRYLTDETRRKARWKSRAVENANIHPEIFDIAKTLSKERTPIEAFEKFSDWLERRISYDVAVPNTLTVGEIMEGGRGHCGHRLAVTRQFAQALGIPLRAGGGATLRHDDSGWQLPSHQIKPISANSHVWAELDIPGIGLVEAEPIGKDKMFEIPHSYIQTRGVAQNHRVEILRNGRWSRADWLTEEDDSGVRFVSPVGEKSTIAYEILTPADENGTLLSSSERSSGEDSTRNREDGGGGQDGIENEPVTLAPEATIAKDTLTATVTLDIARNGFKIGQITLKPGASVDILQKREGKALIQRGTAGPKWVPLDMLAGSG